MMTRYLSATIIAMMVTMTLFFIMQTMVLTERVTLITETPPYYVPIIERTKMLTPKEIDRRVPKPDEPRIEPPTMDIPKAGPGKVATPWDHFPGPQGPSAPGDIDGAAIMSGDMLPLVLVQPDYPRRALLNGVSGHVLVSLSVSAQGLVTDVRVLDATPSGWFESAARAAALKFRYKPRIIDGQAVAVEDVLYRFAFELEEDGKR